MSYTYTWGDVEKTYLRRVDANGESAVVPVESKNIDYQDYLASGYTAADYVVPPEPSPLTAEQKLANSGLTVDELKTLLGI